ARSVPDTRGERPAVAVDCERARRGEVLQSTPPRSARERAAICAPVIHYRARRAIGEVGKVFGLTPDVTAALSKTIWGISDRDVADANIRQAGLDPDNPAIRQAVALANELIGFPRHLSQHVGGFVLTRFRLDETVPGGHPPLEGPPLLR